jgi:hypothetical protein
MFLNHLWISRILLSTCLTSFLVHLLLSGRCRVLPALDRNLHRNYQGWPRLVSSFLHFLPLRRFLRTLWMLRTRFADAVPRTFLFFLFRLPECLILFLWTSRMRLLMHLATSSRLPLDHLLVLKERLLGLFRNLLKEELCRLVLLREPWIYFFCMIGKLWLNELLFFQLQVLLDEVFTDNIK